MTGRKLQDFHPSYFDIAEHFQNSREPLQLPMKMFEAHSIRRDIYRFIQTVRDLSGDDSFAKQMLPAVTDLQLSVSPARGPKDLEVNLIIRKHPLKAGLALGKGKLNPIISPDAEVDAHRDPEKELIDLEGIDTYLKGLLEREN